jgi:ATP-binding protein involved in chromosome partitioning
VTGDAAITPARIAQKGARHLEIAWSDGVVSELEVRSLRLACACAVCVDEWTGEERLDATRVPDDVHPLRIQPVGRYAIQIDWSDGHQSGIYPFRRLREISEPAA